MELTLPPDYNEPESFPICSRRDNKSESNHVFYKHDIFPILIFFFVSFLAYLNSLGNGFHYDDYHSILSNPCIRDFRNIGRFFIDPGMFSSSSEMAMYRPMLLVTYAISYALSGYRPWGWHIINIIIHAANVCLLYFFIRRWVSTAAAAIAATIFAVHPLAAEPINYISARSSLLVTAFMLGSILLYIRYLEAGKLWRLLLSLILFVFGMLSKENGITYIALIIALDLLPIQKGEVKTGRSNLAYIKPWILFCGAGIVYLLMRYKMKLATIPHAHLSRTVYENLLTQAGALLMYFKHFLWPVGLSNVYDIPIAFSLIDSKLPFWCWPLIKGIIVLFPIAASIAWVKRRPQLSFGILWFYITLSPEILWPMNMVATDRRMYLPCIGLIIGAAYLYDEIKIRWTGIRRYTWTGSTAVILISLSALTISRNRDWATDFTLWTDAIKKYPQSYSAYDSLGFYYIHANKPEEAQWAFRKAIRINPDYYFARANLGALLADQGRYEEAVRELEGSIAITQKLGIPNPARITLGNIYLRLGLLDRAEYQLSIAVIENPLTAEAHFNLARVYRSKGKINDAITHFQQAAALDPNLAPEAEKAIQELK